MGLADEPRVLPALYMPSSPPTARQALEDDSVERLPSLPTTRRSPSNLPADALSGAKRRRIESSYNDSSDPAAFSSDNIGPSIDDYTSSREKKVHSGPWWGIAVDSEGRELPKRQRTMERNFDSGVWMGSSSDALSSDPVESQFPEDHSARIPTSPKPKISLPPLTGCDIGSKTLSPSDIAQEKARRFVEMSVDYHRQTIDLSQFDLDEILPSTILPLNHLMPPPLGPERYHSLLPETKLFLAGNQLSTIPGELCSITSLTSISIRQNSLTSLPSRMEDLVNLKQLNVATNRLRFIPYRLRKVLRKRGSIHHLRPNPFILPVSSTLGQRASPSGCEGWHLHFQQERITAEALDAAHWPVAVSTVCFFREDGLPLSPKNPAPTQALSHPPSPQQTPPVTPNIPSLRELVLGQCNATFLIPHLRAYPSDYPDSILRQLESVVTVRKAGGFRCDVCNKDSVVPRAEWIEWWGGYEISDELLNSDYNLPRDIEHDPRDPLPFLLQACSWQCALSRHQDWQASEVMCKDWLGCGWLEEDARF